MANDVDISENEVLARNPAVLAMLLKDHTTQQNIFWATDSYAHLGEGYQPHDQITIARITGEHGMVLRPRATKSQQEQSRRTKDKAEVFTPSWVCNEQNNLVDEAWFGRKDVFNVTTVLPGGTHSWKATAGPIAFPDDEKKTWKRYVAAPVLEVTCGEAPYLVSRYDTVTGAPIPVGERIGLLDRKLRVVGEHTSTTGEWLKMAQKAFMACYGYEWQGDSLALAREAMLFTFLDYYREKFGSLPQSKSIEYIAYIVSWNLWQMDGLRGVVPDSCQNGVKVTVRDLFGEQQQVVNCEGCLKDDLHKHNGTYCLIRDWGHKDPKTGENNRKIPFVKLL